MLALNDQRIPLCPATSVGMVPPMYFKASGALYQKLEQSYCTNYTSHVADSTKVMHLHLLSSFSSFLPSPRFDYPSMPPLWVLLFRCLLLFLRLMAFSFHFVWKVLDPRLGLTR